MQRGWRITQMHRNASRIVKKHQNDSGGPPVAVLQMKLQNPYSYRRILRLLPPMGCKSDVFLRFSAFELQNVVFPLVFIRGT